MDRRRQPRRPETWEELRARLTEALRHPEFAIRIPVIPAGQGRFPPSLARAFWEPLLTD